MGVWARKKKNEVETDNAAETNNDGSEKNTENQSEKQNAAPEGEGGLDEKVLMNMLFEKMFAGVKDDKRIALLYSIKPFVSDRRQKGIDDCIRIMNLVAFFENFMGKAGK